MQSDPIKAALRALAEAATPGPWKSRGKSGKFLSMDGWEIVNWSIPSYSYAPVYAGRNVVAVSVSEGDSAPEITDYIAAAHPAAVLSLLDEVERLRELLAAADEVIDWTGADLLTGPNRSFPEVLRRYGNLRTALVPRA